MHSKKLTREEAFEALMKGRVIEDKDGYKYKFHEGTVYFEEDCDLFCEWSELDSAEYKGFYANLTGYRLARNEVKDEE